MKTLLTLSTIFLLASCAFHSGTLTNNVTDKPVIHTDIAIGAASSHVVFGIGGVSKDAIISEARKNMIQSRPLEGSEQYNNVDVNIKRTFYLIGVKTKVTIHADVIVPKDSVNQASYSENYLKKIARSKPNKELFAIGDSVYYYHSSATEAQIIRFIGDDANRVEISYTDDKKNIRTKKVSINRIFIVQPEHQGLVQYTQTEDGIITAFGTKRVLLSTSGGYYMTVKY